MAVNFSPIFNSQVVDSTGAPASGWKVYTYEAGSSTPLATYTTQAGSVAQSNPIVLNSLGFPTTGQIWLTAGVQYKLVLTDASDVVQKTEDYIEGVNDTELVTIDEWVASGLTPTYISATSLSLPGDVTSTYTVGRRLKTTNTGGTVYSTILTSAYSSVTTLTVVNDSGSLDAGLSAVSYGILQATNKSVPPFNQVVALSSVAGTNTITASATTTAQGYVSGQAYSFVPANTNTGATTLNINSVGAKNVYYSNAACVGGELVQGVPVIVIYDGTQFQITGHATNMAANAGTMNVTSPTVAVTPAVLGMALLNSGSVSAATLDIVLTSYTSYVHKMLIFDLVPATDSVTLHMRVSTDGGSNYDSGASDYGFGISGIDDNATSLSTGGVGSTIGLSANSNVGNGAAEGISGRVTLWNTTSATKRPRFNYETAAITADGTPRVSQIHGAAQRTTAQDTDAVRLLFSSGNIVGTWRLYGFN